jgi:ABC-2 type transport system permease protein
MSRSPLVHGLRVARALFTSQYALMLEYRAEIALWALSGVLPLIMLGVWSGSGAGADAGLSPLQLARYFLAAFVVRQFTIVWVIQAFEEDNLQGRLSPYLLQPLPPLWPFVVVILGLVALVLPGTLWWPSPVSFLLAVVATHLVFLLRFLIQSLITMVCFWSERAAALERLQMIPYLFLSGLVAPLETFPEGMRALAFATPFPWMIWFPARLLGGGEVDVAAGFGALLAWIALLLPLTLLLWKAGIRRYSAMGA